jgi:hypothetical protein
MREIPTQITSESQEEPNGSSFFGPYEFASYEPEHLPETVRRIGELSLRYPGQVRVKIEPNDTARIYYPEG